MKFGGPTTIEDDEVVASYSVYISSSLANDTHIFQYPLRSKVRPYESSDVKVLCTEGMYPTNGKDEASSSTIKPLSRVTMRCSLDTFGSNSFRRQDETSAENNNNFTYSMQSKPFRPRSDYAVGYFTGNELHLSPVSTIQQFTPSLAPPHDDGTLGNSCSGPVTIGDEHCSTQTAPVVPGLSASDRIQRELLRQRSAMLNADASTAKELKFYNIGSIESNSIKKQLLCQTKESAAGLSMLMKSRDHVENSLYPAEILTSGGITGGEDTASSAIIRRYANIHSVSDQVRQVMLRCQVLPLTVLSDVIVPHENDNSPTTRVPDSALVEVLKKCAVYMHGVWVSRNSDQFKGPVAALREVILAQFYKSPQGKVTRASLNDFVSSSSSRRSIKEILGTLAVLNDEESDPSKRYWTLRYVPDDIESYRASVDAFRVAFTSEEASQRSGWEKRLQPIMDNMPYILSGLPPPTLYLAGRVDSSRAAQGLYATRNPQVASPTAAAGSEAVREQDLAAIKQYIRMLFAEHGVLNKLRAKEMVLKGKDINFPRATNQMLSMALQSSVQPFTQSTWVLKTTGEVSVDRHRPLILEVLLELKAFESRAVINRLDDMMADRGEFSKPPPGSAEEVHAIPVALVQRVISEVAEYKSSERLWHLKTGNNMTD